MKESTSKELKSLNKRLLDINTQLDTEKESQKIISKKITVLQNSKREVVSKINSIKDSNKEITISEHAVLRYLQRVKGIDIQEIKKEILTKQFLDTFDVIGNGNIPISKGIVAIVKDRNIVTIEKRG